MRQRSVFFFVALFMCIATAPAKAQDCTNPDGDIGVMLFNLDYGVLQVCTPENWIALHSRTCPEGDGCNAPAGSSCDGAEVGGFCWFYGAYGESCNDVCTGESLYYDEATRSFAGSDGADENCLAVLDALGADGNAISAVAYTAAGCGYSSSLSSRFRMTVATEPAQSSGTARRACACSDTAPPDPCEGSPAVGTECGDGTFYIGLSPEDGAKVYMTSAAHEGSGIRWDSASCLDCGDGSVATSQTDGRANTNALLAFNPTGFDAANHCEGLNATSAHGHTDWYLPAGGANGSSSEINLIWLTVQSAGGVGGLNTSGGWYWSSSELNSTYARIQRFSSGSQVNYVKYDANLVRCVRR